MNNGGSEHNEMMEEILCSEGEDAVWMALEVATATKRWMATADGQGGDGGVAQNDGSREVEAMNTVMEGDAHRRDDAIALGWRYQMQYRWEMKE